MKKYVSTDVEGVTGVTAGKLYRIVGSCMVDDFGVTIRLPLRSTIHDVGTLKEIGADIGDTVGCLIKFVNPFTILDTHMHTHTDSDYYIIEKAVQPEAPAETDDPAPKSGDKYNRTIACNEQGQSDVYDVLKAFDVTCPAMQHALKKMLCAGIRGHKGKAKDIREAIDALERAEEMAGE